MFKRSGQLPFTPSTLSVPCAPGVESIGQLEPMRLHQGFVTQDLNRRIAGHDSSSVHHQRSRAELQGEGEIVSHNELGYPKVAQHLDQLAS